MPLPGGRRAGPNWSTKMNGPTIRLGLGRERAADLEVAKVMGGRE